MPGSMTSRGSKAPKAILRYILKLVQNNYSPMISGCGLRGLDFVVCGLRILSCWVFHAPTCGFDLQIAARNPD